MDSKIGLTQSSFILSIVGIVGFSISMLLLTSDGLISASSSSVAGNSISKEINPSFPIRLKIATIGVDAPIQQLGLTPNGTMDATKGPDDLAWFKLGPVPGNKGSSVIAGHYGERKNGEISVFHDLNKLVKGDKIVVQDENSKEITFIVRESKIYFANENTSEVFNSNDGKSHLNLITCDGIWDKIAKTYHQRLVVFTDKE